MNSDDHLSNPTVEANNTAAQDMPKSRGLGQPVPPVETEQSLERAVLPLLPKAQAAHAP